MDQLDCPHCGRDLSAEALEAQKWKIACVACLLPVAIAYDLKNDHWHYHLEKLGRR